MIYGYWLSSAYSLNSISALLVSYNNYLSYTFVDHDVVFGVRPVIEISKS